ncbi:MAG: hypothetical protein CVV41_09520 [Candidatus Riflebacteria bacterium HGW-Riflebacteria-1]|nr:MAG: hypothetical protein CVV41_09520 [Candidatus Riflebacteria bacterium HGW-Riflebacteria-1]
MSVCAEKTMLNKTSLLLERVYGFVCLLIFQVRVTPGLFFCPARNKVLSVKLNNHQTVTDKQINS